MLKIVAALILSLFCVSVNANVDIEEYCFEAMKLSEAVMSARQYGVSIEDALSVRGSASGDSAVQSARIIHTEIILEAYDSPMYSTEKYKQSEIKEFAAESYLECIKGMRMAQNR
jgi:hypothetical protein